MKAFFILAIASILPVTTWTEETDSGVCQEEVVAGGLKGILILKSWQEFRKQADGKPGQVMVDGISFLRNHPGFLSELQDQYVGKPCTQELISALKYRIAEFYRSHNQPFVVISVPKQSSANGILQLVVEEAKLGNVYVTGNCHFPSRWFAEAIRTNPGEPINAQTLLEDVAWLNLNPFRRTDAVLKPGDRPGFADVELVTVDRWPYRVYMGADNTGTDPTSRNRLFFGFNFGKSVLKDGQISYQFTFAPNWNLFYAHTASARLPLPWRHIWVLWGGYSEVNPHREMYEEQNRGISWQVDTRYRFPFISTPRFMQTFVLGYDFKETNNTILQDAVYILNTDADINQFMVGYELGFRSKETRLSLTAELYANPGGITHANQTPFYERLRFKGKSQYAYFKMAHSAAFQSPFGWLTYDLTGQVASANLLLSEQLAMTGTNGVRGFEERILHLDQGVIFNIAYQTPHWSPGKAFGYCKTLDEFYLIAFFDGAIGGNHTPAPGEARLKRLASAGPGIRYQLDRYFTARFDYGFQIGYEGFHNPSNSLCNFGMMLSY